MHVDTFRTWRGRFAAEGMKGLADRPRSGRPPVFASTVVAEAKSLGCALPAEHGLPLSRWSCRDLADEAVNPRHHRAASLADLVALEVHDPHAWPAAARRRRVSCRSASWSSRS